MLRYLYLLSLLVCINISFCYEYTRENYSKNRPCNEKRKDDTYYRQRRRNIEQRRYRKRRDDMDYDSEPVAQIDVVNFIHSPDEELSEDSDPYQLQFKNKKYGKDYFGSVIGLNEKVNNIDDYSDVDAESLQEHSVNANLDINSSDKVHNDKLIQSSANNGKNMWDEQLNNRHYPKKKCVLKNFKIPFFSHNKSVTTKNKKDRKRTNFSNPNKENGISKENDEKLSNQFNIHENKNLIKHFNINKRSYLERLCPACKRKFITNSTKGKRKVNLQNRYNTRPIYESYLDNENTSPNYYNENTTPTNFDALVDYSGVNDERRKKREEDSRNIEREKELEDLEKKIESVSITSAPNNKYENKA